MKKLISTCKNLQEYLLSYANYKPTKKDSSLLLEKTNKLENIKHEYEIICLILKFQRAFSL